MDVLNFGSNERIDYADLKFAVADSPIGIHSATVGNLLTAQSGQRTSILSGFAASSPSANVVSVTLGRAIGAYRKGAVVQYGVVCAQGDAQKTLDVSALTAGTYGVFVRFTYVEGSQYNRVFWAASGNGYEYAQAQNTRLLANWDLSVELASPGPEWIQVATVVLPAMTFTDTRPLYFEGRVDQGYASTWGAGSDRSANRALYGVGDWQTFAGAMRTCLEDIKGPGLRKWYDPIIGGQNIGFSGAPTASRTAWGDASFYAQGSATVPGVTFDTGDYVTYDRANNRWTFAIGGSATALLGAGVSLGTYASTPTAAPAGGLITSGAVGINTSTVGSNALAVSGNTNLGGTLSVSGASTLAAVGATTGAFTSNVTVGGTLGVTGASTLGATSVTTLSASGTSTLAAVTGTNASFTGTLGVSGTTTLAAMGATNGTFSGTLGVSGATTLAALGATTGSFSSTLSVGGAATLTGGAVPATNNGSSLGATGSLFNQVNCTSILASTGWRYVAQSYQFNANAFAASVTGGQLGAFATNTGYLSVQTPYTGSIAAISVYYIAAASAGTISFQAQKNGVNAGTAMTLTTGTTTIHQKFARGDVPMSAFGDALTIKYTTNSTYSGGTGNFIQIVIYLYDST